MDIDGSVRLIGTRPFVIYGELKGWIIKGENVPFLPELAALGYYMEYLVN